MKFETELAGISENPTEEQILTGLDSIDGDECNFAILSSDDMTYVQTAGDPAIGFVLEYQKGSLAKHYRVKNQELSLDEIKKAFIAYSKGDVSWIDTYEWEKENLSPKSGCMTVLAIALISALTYATVEILDRVG